MKKIVIVEDEKVIREELYALLENAGYGPVAVTDFVHTVPEILNSGGHQYSKDEWRTGAAGNPPEVGNSGDYGDKPHGRAG